jgi:hypothetical protein
VPGHAADPHPQAAVPFQGPDDPAAHLLPAGINMFWLFPLSRLAFMFSPLLYIFFSLEIYKANILEFASYAVTYLISSFAMQSYLYGSVRWPWISELYEYVQAVFLFGSIVSVVRNPRKPTFNVTAKGQTLDKSKLSPLATPYFPSSSCCSPLLSIPATGFSPSRSPANCF